MWDSTLQFKHKKEAVILGFLKVLNSTELHLPPLRIPLWRSLGGCWDRTQDCCDFWHWQLEALVMHSANISSNKCIYELSNSVNLLIIICFPYVSYTEEPSFFHLLIEFPRPAVESNGSQFSKWLSPNISNLGGWFVIQYISIGLLHVKIYVREKYCR